MPPSSKPRPPSNTRSRDLLRITRARPTPVEQDGDIIIISSDDEQPQARRGPPPPKRAHTGASTDGLQEQLDKLLAENNALSSQNRELKSSNQVLATRTQKLDDRYRDASADKQRLTAQLAEARAAAQASQTAAAGPSKQLVSDLDNVVSCEICTTLMWSPYTIACGHTFCQTCLSDWFSTQLANHMSFHPNWQPPQRAAPALAPAANVVAPARNGALVQQVLGLQRNARIRVDDWRRNMPAGGNRGDDPWAVADGNRGDDPWGGVNDNWGLAVGGRGNPFGAPAIEEDVFWGAPVFGNARGGPQGARPALAQLPAARGPQPEYNCPNCRAVTTAKPAENFHIKQIVAIVAKAQGEHSPQRAGGGPIVRARGAGEGPFDGFFAE